MMDYRDSPILQKLVSEGLGRKSVGADKSSGKGAGHAGKSAHPRAAAREGQTTAVQLAWVNPMAIRDATRKRVACLMVIEGGRA